MSSFTLSRQDIYMSSLPLSLQLFLLDHLFSSSFSISLPLSIQLFLYLSIYSSLSISLFPDLSLILYLQLFLPTVLYLIFSILGPLLFLIYINDLPLCSELFALLYFYPTKTWTSSLLKLTLSSKKFLIISDFPNWPFTPKKLNSFYFQIAMRFVPEKF